ncbi:MAG: tail fiber domain-containing protein, partial [Acidobacteriota bacterium]
TGGAEFKIYTNGEVVMGPGGSEVFDLQPSGDLEIAGGLTAGGIYYASDRNKKTDVETLDGARVLEAIARLPVSTWRFKTEDRQIRHAGPMAQDFYAAFELGSDNKTISASDISGVAIAAIQGLYEQTRKELVEKNAQLAAQARQIQNLEAHLSEMEELRRAVAELQSLHRAPADSSEDSRAGE